MIGGVPGTVPSVSEAIDPTDATERTEVVLVAHGSRAAAANDAHASVAARVAEAVGVSVRAAYLELAEPSIGAAIDAAIDAGAARVVVVPHFLYPGRHVGEDIPAIVADAVARHPGAEIDLVAPTGDDAGMLRLLVDVTARAIG